MKKKKHMTVSQIYFANMGYYLVESRGKEVSIWMLFMKSTKMKQHIYE